MHYYCHGKTVLVVDADAAQDGARACLQLAKGITTKGKLILGIDTETEPATRRGRSNPVCLLQVANATLTVLFRIDPTLRLHPHLHSLFERNDVLIVGQDAALDLRDIWWDPLRPSHIAELTDEVYMSSCRCRGIQGYAASFFGVTVNKDMQRSNWSRALLLPAQIEYAALDAWLARALYIAMQPEEFPKAVAARPLFFGGPTRHTSHVAKYPIPHTQQPLTELPLHLRNDWQVDAAVDFGLIPMWSQLLRLDTVNSVDWPHVLVTTADHIPDRLRDFPHTPQWVVLDGGCLPSTKTRQLRARGLVLWASHFSLSVWTTRKESSFSSVPFPNKQALATALLAFIQSELLVSATAVGSKRFKLGFSAADFALDKIASTLTNPSPQDRSWQERPAWRFACTRSAPREPPTSALSDGTGGEPVATLLTGLERVVELSPEDERERRRDLDLWISEGQLWWDAFLPAARRKIQDFLHANAQTNSFVAKQAAMWTNSFEAPFSFGAVPDLLVTQDELRPGARGVLWEWNNGKCSRTTLAKISPSLRFNVSNIRKVCEDIGFQDQQAVQMLLDYGVSDETVNFPLTSYASRNHQGAAKFPAPVRKLMQQRAASGNVTPRHFGSPYSPHPCTLPFGVIPVNGAEAKLKEAEYYNMKNGLDFKPTVRAVFDSSSPHHDTEKISINAHACLDPQKNLPWSSISHFEDALRVLHAIGTTVLAFKVDLEAGYFQMSHQKTQRWRQHYYHRFVHADTVARGCYNYAGDIPDDAVEGGFMADESLLWGKVSGASAFHRSITTITVRYLEHLLVHEWLPTITCAATKQWIENRRKTGIGVPNDPADKSPDRSNVLPERDLLPAFISAFLDDTCVLLAGTTADIARGKAIIMKGFTFLGWILSAKKLDLEGTPAPHIIVLGHGVDCAEACRYIIPLKQDRIKDDAVPAIRNRHIHEDKLESLLGLIQSVRGNVIRRWRLTPLYNCLHSRHRRGSTVHLSTRAVAALRRVVESLDERRSIWQDRPRWDVPTFPLVCSVPNVDASYAGMAGVMIAGSDLVFFSRSWSAALRSLDPDIAILEALTVVSAAAIWGPLWSGKQVVLRCDNTTACFALNTLKAQGNPLNFVIDLWEDIQFRFGFAGLVTHVSSTDNRVADVASRDPTNPDLGSLLLRTTQQSLRKANRLSSVTSVTRAAMALRLPGFPAGIDNHLVRMMRSEPSASEHPTPPRQRRRQR
jgi:hypothetical protein